MGKFLKKFNTHTEYEAAQSSLILPNVSICTTEGDVHYNPYVVCEETNVYEIVGSPSYPSEIEGSDTSFDISFNYKRTDIDSACTETVTEGSDSVTVECGANPSTSNTRTVSGTVAWNDNEIGYSLTQNPKETRVVAKYNVTSTTSPTKISYFLSGRHGDTDGSSGFSAIEIDGVEQPNVITSYTFSTTGEHIVKYALKDPTSICKYAFKNCSGLTSVVIPDSVTSIGEQAFSHCYSLTSIVIPDGVTSIDTQVFEYCSGMTSCTIGSGVTSIGDYAFSDCFSITRFNSDTDGVLNTPNSVTSIGKNVFSQCISITSVYISSIVTSIGNSVFNECRGLTSVTMESTIPPTLGGTSVFYNTNNCPLYVPSGSVDTYKAATNWSTYASRIQAMP